jgi:hypothetical protein
MNAADGWRKRPRFALPLVVGLLIVTFLYSVFVTGTVVLWLAAWSGLLGVGTVLYVVYLLYRLVVAVERIADDS